MKPLPFSKMIDPKRLSVPHSAHASPTPIPSGPLAVIRINQTRSAQGIFIIPPQRVRMDFFSGGQGDSKLC